MTIKHRDYAEKVIFSHQQLCSWTILNSQPKKPYRLIYTKKFIFASIFVSIMFLNISIGKNNKKR